MFQSKVGCRSQGRLPGEGAEEGPSWRVEGKEYSRGYQVVAQDRVCGQEDNALTEVG